MRYKANNVDLYIGGKKVSGFSADYTIINDDIPKCGSIDLEITSPRDFEQRFLRNFTKPLIIDDPALPPRPRPDMPECFTKPLIIDDPWKYDPAKFETNIEVTSEDYFKQYQCNFNKSTKDWGNNNG